MEMRAMLFMELKPYGSTIEDAYPAPVGPPKKRSHAVEAMKLIGTGTPSTRQTRRISTAM